MFQSYINIEKYLYIKYKFNYVKEKKTCREYM